MANRVHVWEKVEITLQAQNIYGNPYVDVTVWVDLKGPGFEKRVYGFWDGGNEFKVRVTATAPGLWRWASGCNQQDGGLNGATGEFEAVAWTEEEKRENDCRRGMLRATENGHALTYADGTPAFLIGDTWYSAASFRYAWHDDDVRRPAGPGMGFKDMVLLRRGQGFNCVAIIASFPAWADDGLPVNIDLDDGEGTCVRSAWKNPDSGSAKDMHNEGGRAFLFPGKAPGYETVVPDFDRINPDYFKHLDRKIDFLNANGFTPIIETVRRDASQIWKKYHGWPDSFARYIQYVFSRYQANNCILSPIHYDYEKQSVPAEDYNEAANLVVDTFGPPPFGTLVTANASMSTLLNFGGPERAKWLTLHQLANFREHEYYWYLTEIFHADPPRPAINGEPYYPFEGHVDPYAPEEIQNLNSRSGLYGSFLSGGFAGYVYGAEGMWGGDVEASSRFKLWETIQFSSGGELRHIREFMKGVDLPALVPDAELVLPNKSGPGLGFRGWAYCAATGKRDTALYYFENDCPQVLLRGLLPGRDYGIRWFNPRSGTWHAEARFDSVQADRFGRFNLPPFPSEEDWAMALTLCGKP